MILGLITLLTAFCISGIAAYYSIVGLTAIFAAAYWPIVIMGGVLEVGKVVTTLWLHYNWDRAEWKIKSYLVSAVGVLMLITSMGIFGFLSKSHLDQAVPSGDVQAQVRLFDEKIKTQRDNIDSARKALTQLDSAVDQTMARTTDDTGATKSANLRRSQQKERGRLQADIDAAQKQITVLQEQRAPIASQYRKVEAEVGPIRYIAALIYGDKADQNMLEAAVRWVIIIIVLVFDPLAIVLILAATTSIDWSKLDRKKKKHDEMEEKKEDARVEAELAETLESLKHHGLIQSEEEILKIVEDTIALTRAECAAEAEKARLKGCEECSVNLEQKLAEANALKTQRTEEQSQREQQIAEISGLLIKMTNDANDLASFVNGLEEEVSESLRKKGKLQGDLHLVINDYDDLLLQKASLEAAFEEAKKELLILDEAVRQMGLLQDLLADRDEEIVRLNAALEATAKLVIETPLPTLPSLALPTTEIRDGAGGVFGNDPNGNYVGGFIEEQPPSGTLTDPRVARMAFDAVFRDHPLYFKPKEPGVVVDEKLEVDTEPAAEMPAPVDQPVLPLLPAKRTIVMPQLSAVPDNFPMGGNASFGVTFPPNPFKGDLFLRVDYMPSKLFKWTDTRWIEVDKEISDTYAYDEEYIKLLISQIESGEQDPDDLNTTEQEQIASYLSKNQIK